MSGTWNNPIVEHQVVFAKENTVVNEDVRGLALENAKFRK